MRASAEIIALPTPKTAHAARAALAKLDCPKVSVVAFREARQLLAALGLNFAGLSDAVIYREPDTILDHDAPINYPAIKALFERYRETISLSHHVALGDLMNRLRRGAEATIDDRRMLADIRGRLRSGRS
jgi:hypothetical protein